MSNIVDKKQADALMAKCRAAVNEVLAAEGFELTKVSGKYGDSFGFSFSAIPSVKNELGLNPNAAEVLDFHRCHTLFKLEPNALGVQFAVGGKHYTFEGLKIGRSKYPIAVKDNAAGKKMLLTDDPRVIEAINAAARLAPANPTPAEAPAPTGKVPRTSNKP